MLTLYYNLDKTLNTLLYGLGLLVGQKLLVGVEKT